MKSNTTYITIWLRYKSAHVQACVYVTQASVDHRDNPSKNAEEIFILQTLKYLSASKFFPDQTARHGGDAYATWKYLKKKHVLQTQAVLQVVFIKPLQS